MVDYNSLFIKHTDCNIHTITLIRDSILASSNKLQDKLNLLDEMELLFSKMLDNSRLLTQFLNEVDTHFTHSRGEIENFSDWLKKLKRALAILIGFLVRRTFYQSIQRLKPGI